MNWTSRSIVRRTLGAFIAILGVLFGLAKTCGIAYAGGFIGTASMGGVASGGGLVGGGSSAGCSNANEAATRLDCNGFSWIFYESLVEASEAEDMYFMPEFARCIQTNIADSLMGKCTRYAYDMVNIPKECAAHKDQNGGFWHFGENARGPASGNDTLDVNKKWPDGFGGSEWAEREIYEEGGYEYRYWIEPLRYGHDTTYNYDYLTQYRKWSLDQGLYLTTTKVNGTPMNNQLGHTLYKRKKDGGDWKAVYTATKMATAESGVSVQQAFNNAEVLEAYQKAYVAENPGEEPPSTIAGDVQIFCYWDDTDQPDEPDEPEQEYFAQSTAKATEVGNERKSTYADSGKRPEADLTKVPVETDGYWGDGWAYENSIYLKPGASAYVDFTHNIYATRRQTEDTNWTMGMLFFRPGNDSDSSYEYLEKVPLVDGRTKIGDVIELAGKAIFDKEDGDYFKGSNRTGGVTLGNANYENSGNMIMDRYQIGFKRATYRRKFCERIKIGDVKYTSVCTGIILPYSFKNEIDGFETTTETFYAGEKANFKFNVKVNPVDTNTSVDTEPYATQVDNPRYATVSYIVGSESEADDEMRMDPRQTASGKDDAYLGGVLCDGFAASSGCKVQFGERSLSGGRDDDAKQSWNLTTEGRVENVQQGVTVQDLRATVDIPDRSGWYCVAAAVFPYESVANNSGDIEEGEMYDASGKYNYYANEGTKQWYVSAPICKQIMKKPLFQVLGSGIFAESGSTISALLSDKAIGMTRYTFGSWGEQAVISNGSVENVASGAALAGGYENGSFCENLVPLSVANDGGAEGGLCQSDQKTGEAGINAEVASLRDLIGGGLEGNRNIDEDIIVPDDRSYGSLAEIRAEAAKHIIAAEKITISCDVKRIDAFLVAKKIETGDCGDQLIINGAVEILEDGSLELGRTYGAGSGDESAIPAEIINFNGIPLTLTGGDALRVVSQRELPPRY